MSDELDPRLTGPRGVQRETVAVSRGVPRQRGEGAAGARGVQRETVAVSPRIPARLRGVFTAGVVTSCWNGLVVFTPILMVVIAIWWVAGRHEAVNQVARFAGALWLLGHDVPVTIGGGVVGFPPLVLTGFVCWRLSRAGAHTIRAIRGRDFAAVRAATLSVVVAYTIVVTVVALLVSNSDVSVVVWRAAANAAGLAAVFGALGALGESGGGHALWHRFPVWLRRGLRAGLLSTVILLAAGAMLAGVALAVRGGPVAAIVDSYGGAQLAVGLVCLIFLPTVAVWAVAYLVGPGFVLGADTSVRIIGVELGATLPPFPLLGGTPVEPLNSWGTVLLGVPLVIGVFYGVQLGLRSRDLRIPQLFWASLLSGVAVFVLVAALVGVSGGGLGGMAMVDPPLLQTAGVAAGEVGVAVLVGALAVRFLARRGKA